MNTGQEAIDSAVTARVRSFEAAECARDAEALVAHYASVPEFYLEGTGATVRQQGAVSRLWRKMGAQWLIVQGHISHPLEAAK